MRAAMLSCAALWWPAAAAADTVATPSFSIQGGSYATGFEVEVTCGTTGATIRYTVNGQDPILIDPAIGEGETLLVSGSVTLKARAWKDGMDASAVATAEYRITGEVAAGGYHALGLQSGGVVSSWGRDDAGQLGRSGVLDVPEAVPGMTNGLNVAAGLKHSLALLDDGTIWAWGTNSYGQLGDDTFTRRTAPVQVVGLTGAVQIAAGENFSMALMADGTVRAWGDNAAGQLGDGTTNKSKVPISVPGISNAVEIAAGRSHSLVLLEDGTVRAAGQNTWGQLGDGSTNNQWSPVAVTNLTNVVQIAAGSYFSAALDGAGQLYCWGSGTNGGLGMGDTANRLIPTAVPGMSNIVTVATTKRQFGYAIDAVGQLWGWGENAMWQMGDGGTTNRLAPGLIPLPGGAAVAAGGYHAGYAALLDGSLWAWGEGSYGEIGDGASADRTVPVLVPDFALSPGTDESGPVFVQSSATGKFVYMDAEHFATNIARGGHSWAFGTNYAGYFGEGHMAALPDIGTNWPSGFAANSPRLDFKVRFVQTGDFHVWVRGIASNANDMVHAGLDGMPVAQADQINGFGTSWTWRKTAQGGNPAKINVTAVGVHALNIWMGQDGLAIDKIILTADSKYTPPSGLITNESPCEARLYPDVSLDSPTNGSIFGLGTNIDISGSASDSVGTISKVEFFQGTNKIAEDLLAPYAVTWTNPPAGDHLLSVRATDNDGMSRTAGPVSISVLYPDSDGDGLRDDQEAALGTDPNDADTDDDGLGDGAEVTANTNPLNPDTDGDRVPDGVDGNPLNHSTDDGTGLTVRWFGDAALGSLQSTTNGLTVNYDWGWGAPSGLPANSFSAAWTGLIEPRYTETYTFVASSDNGIRVWIDDQLVIDRWWWSHGHTGTIALEANKRYSIRVHYRETGGAANVKLEWRSASQAQEVLPLSRLYPETDVDGDGVADGWELGQYGSLTDAGGTGDADGDGLSNEEEFLRLTDFLDADTDDDGLGDGNEVNTRGTNPLAKDTDYDGLPDKWEADNGYSPTNAEDMGADSDGDGLRLAQEQWLGTNPSDPDSGPDSDGVLRREIWDGIGGYGVISLTSNGNFPTNVSSVTFHCALACPTDRGEDYGSRVRGYIVAPQTGTYEFWVTGDDETQFWLSSSTNKFDRWRLGIMAGATYLDEFDKYETQYSGPVQLVGGQRYYFEVLHKEGGGGDTIGVLWSIAGGRREVIPSSVLRQYVAGAADTGDTDDDDLPDAWEQAHFGNLAQDARGDGDGDGLDNGQEARLGSDPNEADAEAFGGTARWEWWDGIWDETISYLTNDYRYPDQPTGSGYAERFETPAWFGDYTGHRLSGWLQAPSSGQYTFWISAGGNAQLALCTNAAPSTNEVVIAEIEEYSSYPDFHWFDWLPSQQSDPVTLTEGQWYRFDVHYVNAYGRDHVAVAWLPPGEERRQIIPGRYLRASFTDSDDDSMDDGWEARIVDSVTNDAIASIQDVLPGDDFDGDRIPNIFEWARFSDPISAASVPHDILRVDPGGGGDFETIQAAINGAVGQYPIISVAPGTHAGGIALTNGPVLLLGELGTSNGPPVIATSAGSTNAAIRIDSDSAVDGFVVTRAPGGYGGGILVGSNAAPRLVNLIVRDNVAENGAGLYNDGGSPSLIHCTFAHNAAATNGHGNGIYSAGGSVTALNSILWDGGGGAPEEVYLALGGASCTNSIVAGGQYGGTNADPLLTRWGYLMTNSPAIGTGTNVMASAIDINGETRNRANGPDLGADEFLDTDGDGLPDWWEALYAGYADDGDGLSALDEYRYGTHPGLSDSDGDGMPDGWEVANGLDPADNGGLDPRQGPGGDLDGDGAPNGQDADPDDPAVGLLRVTITTPADGSIQ